MSLTTGARIGPYEILTSLGAGGMGEVYHARDLRLGRAVAIKVLTSSRRVESAQLERFHREARALARLSHPYICTLYDVGQQDGVAYLIMELLEGETLAERLESGPLPIDRALALAVQIAEALDAAHTKGVIHRDLKTSNIMLTASGVKLLDFGLAKLVHGEDDESRRTPTESLNLTGEGGVLGTLPYMAPEQIEGRDADERTDVFALGVVLFEMTTRRAPIEGPSRASLAAAILTHDPPPVSSLTSGAPPSLDRIVAKCLAKAPDERWQSARDLAAALRWSADDRRMRPITTRPLRKRGRVGAAVVAGFAIVAATRPGTVVAWRRALVWRAIVEPSVHSGDVPYRTVSSARFAPDGDTVVYSAAWGGQPYALFMTRRGSTESRALNVPDAKLLGVSSTGELAFLRGTHNVLSCYRRPVSGRSFACP